jgi:hypothetical protein
LIWLSGKTFDSIIEFKYLDVRNRKIFQRATREQVVGFSKEVLRF